MEDNKTTKKFDDMSVLPNEGEFPSWEDCEESNTE